MTVRKTRDARTIRQAAKQLVLAIACLSAVSAGSAQEASQTDDPSFDVSVSNPTYRARHPRVLFDEGHFNAHTSSSTYAAFTRLATNDGYRVSPNRGRLSRAALTDFQIVVIANALGAADSESAQAARSAFSEEETDALLAWIRAGGSLLLITDHEPAASAVDALTARLSIGTSKNFALDRQNFFTRAGWPGNLVFSRDQGLLGDHPILNGRNEGERVNRVLSFGGQSLSGPPGSTALLRLSDTATTLFAYPARQVEVSAAGRSLAIAMRYGRGRIVVTGEAAMLSAQLLREGSVSQPFGMNVPGFDNRQLALNIMHWLSGAIR